MLSRLLLVCIGSALLAGCASPGGQVALSSVDGKQNLTQDFSEAYISHDTRGEYDIVLVDQGLPPRVKKLDKPLQPLRTPPLRQIMHIHLYWRPVFGTVTNNPAAINASIEWYVLGYNSDGLGNMVYYRGAGLAALEEHGRDVVVTIRDGQLRPTSRRGTLSDPIGPAVLSGSARARVDDIRVRDLLAEVRQAQ